MNRMQRGAAAMGGLLAFMTPALALACPYCAGRPDGGVTQLILLGSFIFLPFAVVAVVYRFVKAGEASSKSPL